MNRNKDHFIFLLTRELKNIKCIIRFIERIILKIFYHWNQKEYLASEIFDLTEEEKSRINHQMIDEIEEEK